MQILCELNQASGLSSLSLSFFICKSEDCKCVHIPGLSRARAQPCTSMWSGPRNSPVLTVTVGRCVVYTGTAICCFHDGDDQSTPGTGPPRATPGTGVLPPSLPLGDYSQAWGSPSSHPGPCRGVATNPLGSWVPSRLHRSQSVTQGSC